MLFLTIKPSHIAWRPLLLKDTEVFLSITALIQITYQLWNLWSIPNMKYYSSFKRNEWNIYISSPHDKRYFKNVISYNHLNMMLWTGRRKWKNTYQVVKWPGWECKWGWEDRNKCTEKGQQREEKRRNHFTLKHIKYTLLIAYVCRKYMFKNHITLLHTQKNIIVNRISSLHYMSLQLWNSGICSRLRGRNLGMTPITLTSYLRASEQVPQFPWGSRSHDSQSKR